MAGSDVAITVESRFSMNRRVGDDQRQQHDARHQPAPLGPGHHLVDDRGRKTWDFSLFPRKLAMALATAAALVSITTIAAAGPVLDRILAKRQMIMATDPEYPPQSNLTKSGDFEGFDIDVGREIARRLGVELKFVTPGWDVITAGNWQNRWDISVGSMSPTRQRSKYLDFPAIYYNTPATLVVHMANRDITSPELASGKAIGVGIATTYESYLRHSLEIDVPGAVEFDYLIAEPRIHTYDTDQLALDDLKRGDGTKLDAVITAMPCTPRRRQAPSRAVRRPGS